MPKLSHVQEIRTIEDFEKFLNIDRCRITCLKYLSNKEWLYKEFKINKRRNGLREICAPKKDLRIVQQQFNTILSDDYSANETTHGFVRGRNVVSNAIQHIGKKIILNLDIKNFFDSIPTSKIKDLFTSEQFNIKEEWASSLADIFTYKNRLPQGAPTSPILSNMVCKNLDEKLSEFAQKNNYTYTRYADDLTFSTNKNEITKEEIRTIREIVNEEGLTVNEDKIKIKRQSTHQEVTGLTVNKKLNVRRSYLKNVRAVLHDWKVNGIETTIQKYAKKYPRNRQARCFVHSIRGKIEYIGMVRGKDDRVYLKLLTDYYKLLSSEDKNFHYHPNYLGTMNWILNNKIEAKKYYNYLIK